MLTAMRSLRRSARSTTASSPRARPRRAISPSTIVRRRVVNDGARRLYERLGFAVTGIDGEFVCMEYAAAGAD